MKRSQLVQLIKEELANKQTLNEDLDAIITNFIETDDATELKAYIKSLPDMARRKIAKIFKIELDEEVGYSKYAPGGTTKGGTTDDFRNILTRIAKGEDQVARGNAILDKANPENVARITRGEKPVYEEKGRQYAKEDLIWYLDRLEPSTQVTIPRIHPGGFSRTEGWRTTAAEAIDALNQTDLDGKFKLYQDNPNYKSFSLVQSDEEMQGMEKLVRGMGSLD